MRIHIDFETRSAADLRKVGLYNYARHPTTEVMCLGYAVDDAEPVSIRKNTHFFQLQDLILKNDAAVIAHNATFELEIWNTLLVNMGLEPLDPEQVDCTMARAYAMSLPGSLENACSALGLTEQKDPKGHRLMLQLCKPRKVEDDGTIIWWEDADKFRALCEYCKQDVRAERALDERLLALSQSERKVWALDYETNQRGVYIDTKIAHKLNHIVDAVRSKLDEEMRLVTDSAVGACSEVSKLVEWLQSKGVRTGSVNKSAVTTLLERDDLQWVCREALELRQASAKSSTAKLRKMLDVACPDGRARGLLQYHGASTGRWAGRHLQIHNLPRPIYEQSEIEDALDAVAQHNPTEAAQLISMLYGHPMEVVSSCLRAVISAPPGRVLVGGDWSAIEARKLAWMANERWVLDVFRGDGQMYERNAAVIYDKEQDAISKHERFVGKVAELALGYQGGVGAFQTMAIAYGLKVSDDFAETVKRKWREQRPNIVDFWHRIERAAMQAVYEPGTIQKEGLCVSFKKSGSFLWCQLPSRRVLCYPYPKLREVETPWGEMRPALHYMGINQRTRKWEELYTYGGKLTENVVQASCADLLRNTLLRLEQSKYDGTLETVFHVHDEIVCEANDDVTKDHARNVLQAEMCTLPFWAKGLPIAAETWVGQRYRK